MFWLKRVSGNHFTPLYVFGKHRKLGQTEIEFPVDCKISLIRCKTISAFILPSNYFRTWKIEEREKEREREQEEIAPQPNPRSHHRPQPQIAPVLSYPNTSKIAPPENTHLKRKSSSTLQLKNPSTFSPVKSLSLFKPILVGDAQNHPSTQGPAVTCKPLRRPIPCPHPLPTHPSSSPTHPLFEPTCTFKSSFTNWKVIAKHKSEPCHLVLVAIEARCQCQTQIKALTRFQPLSIYHSLSLNLSLFLLSTLCLIEFESLMVLFWFLFL